MSRRRNRIEEEDDDDEVIFISESSSKPLNRRQPTSSSSSIPLLSNKLNLTAPAAVAIVSSIPQKKQKVISRSNSIEQHRASAWTCQVCGEDNSAGGPTCEFCDEKRPQTAASAASAISKKPQASIIEQKGKPQKKLRVARDENTLDWSSKYTPKTLDDLKITLAKAKVDQVVLDIQTGLLGQGPRLIVLHGPTGSGKSTTVKVAAKELGWVIRDWDEESTFNSNSNRQERSENEFYVPYVRQSELFGRFLNDCCYPSLQFKTVAKADKGTVVMLEGMPKSASSSTSSTSTNDSEAKLSACLSRLSANPSLRTCIVYILTVDGENGASPAHITEAIGACNVPYAKLINFSGVPEGRLTKTLQNVAQLEGISLEKVGLNDASVFDGDIRTALNNLQFLSLTSSGDRSTVKIVKQTAAKGKASKPDNTQSLMNRDSSYELCHAVAKLIRGPKAPPDPPFRPEDVARNCALDPGALASFVHENFYKYASAADCDLRGYNDLLQGLVDADCLIGKKFHILERSGGDDDVDGSDALAESIISRSAPVWNRYTSVQSMGSLIRVTKPQFYDVDRSTRESLKNVNQYLRDRGDCTPAGKFVYETLPFSSRITTSHDFLNPFLKFGRLPSVPVGRGHAARKALAEDWQIDPSLLLEEPIDEF